MAEASLGSAVLVTRLDLGGLRRGFADAKKDAGEAIDSIGKRIDTLGTKMTSIGKSWSLKVTAPIMALGAGVVKLSADFEASMNRVSALSGATGQSLDRLKNQARQLGADTQFSASEAADAMGFLAMAGFEVEQIYASMPDTLNLAAAAQLDMGSAADIVSNIMTGFGIPVDQLGDSVDVLTKAFISSNTDLRQLGEGMKFVGPVASGFGVSIEQTTAALGALSNAGIQGGMAGTTLRGIINTLASEADKLGISTLDASGKMRPLADIIDELNASGIDTAETMEIFGLRGGPGMAALLAQGGQALRDFTGELEDAGGTAEHVAETQMQGLSGQLKELKSAAEELMLSFGDAGLLSGITTMTKGLTGLVRRLNEMPEATRKWVIGAAGIAAAIGPISLGLGAVAKALPLVVSGFGLLKAATLFLVASPLGLAITGIAVALGGLTVALGNARQRADELADSARKAAVALNQATLQARGFAGVQAFETDDEQARAMDVLQDRLVELTVLYDSARERREELLDASKSKSWSRAEAEEYVRLTEHVRDYQSALEDTRATLSAQAALQPSFRDAGPDVPDLDFSAPAVSTAASTITREVRTVNSVLRDYETAVTNAARESDLLVNAGFDPVAAHADLMTTELREAERALNALLTEDLAGAAATQDQLEAVAEKVVTLRTEVEKLRGVSDPMAGVRVWTGRLGLELAAGLKEPQQVIDILRPKLQELQDEYEAILDGSAEWDWTHLQLLETQIEQIKTTVDEAAEAIGAAFAEEQASRNLRPDENEYGGMSPHLRARHDPWADARHAAEVKAAEQLREIERRKGEQRRAGYELLREVEAAQWDEVEALRAAADEAERKLEAERESARQNRAFTGGRSGEFAGRMQTQLTPVTTLGNVVTTIMHDFDRDFTTWQAGMNRLQSMADGASQRLDELRAAGQVGSDAWKEQEQILRVVETALTNLSATVDDTRKQFGGFDSAARAANQRGEEVPRQSGWDRSQREAEAVMAQWTHGLISSEEALAELDVIGDNLMRTFERLSEAGLVTSDRFLRTAAALDGVSGSRGRITDSDKRDNEAAQVITDAGTQFSADVAMAGVSFTDTLVTSIQSGETGKVIQGVFEAGGSVLQAAITQAAIKDATSGLGALGPWGAVIGAGLSLIGGLFASGGSNRQREEEARRAEARQSRSTPAISVTAVMTQNNQFTTGITDPATRHALDQQVRQVVLATLEAVGLDTIMQKGAVAT